MNSRLWLGTWSLGGEGFGPVDARESRKIIEYALEQGITHFDTANFYAHGKSESYLSQVLKSSGQARENYFISSKGGLLWQGNSVKHDASPQALIETLYKSLDTLKTDYIDLYQLHWPDPGTPIATSIETLKDLQKKGLIRHWGVGNLSITELEQSCPENTGIHHQVRHNPIHRNDEVLIAGRRNHIAKNCIISPLEQGLLSHSTTAMPNTRLGKKDVRRRNPYFSSPEIGQWLHTYQQLIAKQSFSCAQIALLWQFQQIEVDAVIIGPKRMHQLKDCLAVLPLINSSKFHDKKETQAIRAHISEELLQHLSSPPILKSTS